MKLLPSLFLVVGILSVSMEPMCGQLPNLRRASAQITFRIVTDQGKSVEGIEVAMSTFHHWKPGEGFGKDITSTYTGITDANGIVTISGESLRGEFSYGPLPKEGFYGGGGGKYQFEEVKAGKWQPWNPTIEVVIKPIINPIPMYGRKIGITKSLTIPVVGQPVGFDLMDGEWVTPYGKGHTPDLIFTLIEIVPYVNSQKPFAVTLTITFANKGDGIQSVLAPIDKGSDLRLPRYAPKDGYEPQLVKQISRSSEKTPINPGIREDQNYFFRVRSTLGQGGKIQSALYGKIDGDIQFWGNRKVCFTYCLNPNQGDRNMEFDPKKNLFGDLPFNERTTKP